jgi:threonine dehydrogenase-like Zn-dependent dehydrogenase
MGYRHRIADRVVVPFTIACGRCYFCKEQLWSLCDNSNSNAAVPCRSSVPLRQPSRGQ